MLQYFMNFYSGRVQLKPFGDYAVSHRCNTYRNSLQDHVKGVAMINTPICAGDHSTMAWGHSQKPKWVHSYKKICPTTEGKTYYCNQICGKIPLFLYYLDFDLYTLTEKR